MSNQNNTPTPVTSTPATTDLKESMEKKIDAEIEEAINAQPQEVKAKLSYLQKLNKEREVVEKDYTKEYIDIKYDYETKCKAIYEKISEIVRGSQQVVFSSVREEDAKKYEIADDGKVDENGIPEYWLKAMDHSKYFFFMNNMDRDVLKFLEDVVLEIHENKIDFTVRFKFQNNPYFDHTELTKSYRYNDDDDVVGVLITPEEIQWKENSKNPTKKSKKKKAKKGKKSTTSGEVVWEDVESFFQLFGKPKPDDDAYLAEAKDEADFLREDLIPNSMEYFLDIMDKEDFDGEEGEFDEDEEGEDDEEDDHHGHKHQKKGGDKKPKKGGEDDKKCKNQ